MENSGQVDESRIKPETEDTSDREKIVRQVTDRLERLVGQMEACENTMKNFVELTHR
jgi:hypothetical protein